MVLDGGWQAAHGDLDGRRSTWQAGAQSLPVGPGAQKLRRIASGIRPSSAVAPAQQCVDLRAEEWP
eukprot:10034008-Alexandrium_andersonii.AAC.1